MSFIAENIVRISSFYTFAQQEPNNNDMKSKSPERLSFHELRSIMGSFKSDRKPIWYIGKGMAMLGGRHNEFQKIFQPDTPYIIEDCRIGYIKSGKISLTVNLIEHEYGAGTFAFISSGSILQISRMSDDFDLCGMMLSDERLKAASDTVLPTWCNGSASFFTIHPQAEDATTILQMFNTIWQLINKERFPDETLNGLIYAIIHYYSYLKSIETDTAQPETSRRNKLFNTFIDLVNANAKHERKLQFYADKMCVTPRYLSTAIKQASGITAKEWIDRAVVTNAKIMLKYSSKQVTEIAYALEFPNASFFCKYFKHATGLTPQEYRGKQF